MDVIGLLHTVMVAPITSTIRGAPSEVIIGAAEGLKHDSAINLDHVQTVEQPAGSPNRPGHSGDDAAGLSCTRNRRRLRRLTRSGCTRARLTVAEGMGVRVRS
jgi:mRNA-degrading endonuclease toxin of MazEF toxin-antitoxin module